MKILHLAESGAFGMERTIEHGKREVAAGWFVKWGYYYIVWQIDQNCRCGKPSGLL